MSLRVLPLSRLAGASCLILLLAGCAIHRAPEPLAQSIVLSDSLAHGVPAWEKEAKQRFDHPILLVVHGGTDASGEWVIAPDCGPSMSVEGTVRLLKKLYPQRPIVLVCCNPSGKPLHVVGVYYSRRLVSSVPHLGKREWAETIWDFSQGE